MELKSQKQQQQESSKKAGARSSMLPLDALPRGAEQPASGAEALALGIHAAVSFWYRIAVP